MIQPHGSIFILLFKSINTYFKSKMKIQCPGRMMINELVPQHLQLVSQPLGLVPAPLELLPKPLELLPELPEALNLHAYLWNTSGAKWIVKIWRAEKTHSRSSSCLAAPMQGQLGVGQGRSQASRG